MSLSGKRLQLVQIAFWILGFSGLAGDLNEIKQSYGWFQRGKDQQQSSRCSFSG